MKTIKENEINDIYGYMEECYFEPGRNWPRDQVEKRCCERWALKEFLRRVAKTDAGSINVAMDFIEELRACEDYGDKSSYKFRYAIDVMEEVAIILSQSDI